ncbi:unnamed protein product [Gulo gulo]|uniref:Uncharacterized protein n=1 Tax=Gulo gulo TaxID=48420 RepID=A0A9X9Q776_GULGU|nr:unnamed protein product [Gulo gulo]
MESPHPRSYHVTSFPALSFTSAERPSWTIPTIVAQAPKCSLSFFPAALFQNTTFYEIPLFNWWLLGSLQSTEAGCQHPGRTCCLGPHSLLHPEESVAYHRHIIPAPSHLR